MSLVPYRVTSPGTNVGATVTSSMDKVQGQVSAGLQFATARAAELQSMTSGFLSAMGNIDLGAAGDAVAALPPFTTVAMEPFDMPEISANSFGTITAVVPEVPELGSIEMDAGDSIAPFTPTPVTVVMPETPALNGSVPVPQKPKLTEIEAPEWVDIKIPAVPNFTPITPVDFGSGVGEFVAEVPLNTPPKLAVLAAAVVDSPDTAEFKTNLVDRVNGWLVDGGLPKDWMRDTLSISDAPFSRDEARAVSETYAVYSARGFSMPDGVLHAMQTQVRDKAAAQRSAARVELSTKLVETRIDTLHKAVNISVALQQVLNDVHSKTREMMLDLYKAQLSANVSVYQTAVGLHNAATALYQAKAEVWRTKATTYIDELKARIETERLKVDQNSTAAEAFKTELEGVTAAVDMFKAKLSTTSVLAELNKNRVEAYGAEVQAYVASFEADKATVSLFTAQVEGEAAKIGVLEAEAKAYAAAVGGRSVELDGKLKSAELQAKQNEDVLRRYAGAVEATRASITAQGEGIRAAAAAYEANTSRFTAQAGAQSEQARANVAMNEANMRASISHFEAAIKLYESNNQRSIDRARLASENMRAGAQVSATLAAGAMAGIHVGSTMNASVGADMGTSESYNNGYNASVSSSENIQVKD